MSLEDISEMQIMFRDYDYEGWYRPFQKDRDKTFRGKFVLAKAYKGAFSTPPLRFFIFSENGAESHIDMAAHLIHSLYDKYPADLSDTALSLTAIGGGMLEVKGSKMTFSGKSDAFGNYDKDKVREIAQRYCAENGLDLEVL